MQGVRGADSTAGEGRGVARYRFAKEEIGGESREGEGEGMEVERSMEGEASVEESLREEG